MKLSHSLFRFMRVVALTLILLAVPASDANSLLIEAESLESLSGRQMSRDTKVVSEFLVSGLKGRVAPATRPSDGSATIRAITLTA